MLKSIGFNENTRTSQNIFEQILITIRDIVKKKLYFLEFTKILLLSETYRRPIGDPSETDMPDRKPRHASSEIDMPHR